MNIEEYLIKRDTILGKVIDVCGRTNYLSEKREPFDSLAKAIISQQLSNSASTSIVNKIIEIHGKRPFKASLFLNTTDDLFRDCGVSKNKIKALKGIATAVLKSELSIHKFEKLNDTEALDKLTTYWGVGPWTAEMFMMFCLKRLDVFALGDAGLQRAHRILYPNSISLEITCENWRPYRAVAAIYLWKFIDNPENHFKILY